MDVRASEESVRAAWLALAHAAEPADTAVARLVDRHGPVEAADRIRRGMSGLRHQQGLLARLRSQQPESADERAGRIGARIITRGEPEWPTQVDALEPLTPFALWIMGAADLRLLALRSVSIVGARTCTMYGVETARSWAAELASLGWTVISGAARGIDAAAHQGALAAEGVTVAVVAGGVDVPYPRAHAPLLTAIADQGLVVSEVPLGENVRRQRFLSRNRVIAALSRATVVVEAAERSGTTATARAAYAMARPVLAVPGPVTSLASRGCHRMIQTGEAQLAAAFDDVLAAVDLEAGLQRGGPDDDDSMGQPDLIASRVRDAIPARGGITSEGIVCATGLSEQDVSPALTRLVDDGLLEYGHEGWRLTDRGRRGH